MSNTWHKPGKTKKLRSAPPVVAAMLLASAAACGTALYKHDVQITVDDSGGRVGSAPLEVSIFDSRMGTSKDFARKNVGLTSATAPYRHNFSTTAAVLVGSAPRPHSLELSVAVPAIIERGFLVLRVRPGVTLSGRDTAGYLLYSESEPAGDGPRVPFEYAATPLPEGWALHIRIKVPDR